MIQLVRLIMRWRARVGRAPILAVRAVSTRDLRYVSARQHDRDQLGQREHHPDNGVDDHHGDDVVLELGLQDGQAAVDKDGVANVFVVILQRMVETVL